MQIQLWSTLKKKSFLLKAEKNPKAKKPIIFNPLRWPSTWVRKGQEKEKSYMRIIKNAVPESKDINLVQEWETSRERCDTRGCSRASRRDGAAFGVRQQRWGEKPALDVAPRREGAHGDSGAAGGGQRQPAPRRVLRESGERTGWWALETSPAAER